MRTSRFALFDLIWTQPMRGAAKSIGISDVGLKKVCLRNNIPVPPVGHWNKPVNRRGGRAKLPKPSDDWRIEIYVQPAKPEVDAEAIAPTAAAQLAALRSAKPIGVATGPPKPGSTAERMGKLLRSAKPDKYGSHRCDDPRCFTVRVSPGAINRAVSIANTLIAGALSLDFELVMGAGAPHPSPARLAMEGEWVTFSIEETAHRQHHKPTVAELANIRRYGYSSAPIYDFVPSGVFAISVHGRT